MEQNYLYHDPEDAHVYTRHSFLNRTKSFTIVIIVQPLLDGPEIAECDQEIAECDPNRVFTQDKISQSRSRSRSQSKEVLSMLLG